MKNEEQVVPNVLLRKSKGRINVQKVVNTRLNLIAKRKEEQPLLISTLPYPTANKNHKFSKGGYPLNKNSMPLNENNTNALKR